MHGPAQHASGRSWILGHRLRETAALVMETSQDWFSIFLGATLWQRHGKLKPALPRCLVQIESGADRRREGAGDPGGCLGPGGGPRVIYAHQCCGQGGQGEGGIQDMMAKDQVATESQGHILK